MNVWIGIGATGLIGGALFCVVAIAVLAFLGFLLEQAREDIAANASERAAVGQSQNHVGVNTDQEGRDHV